MPGIGRQDGPLRPQWGHGWADLTCDTCGATWVGPVGEACGWCDMAEERQRQWQAEVLLSTELPDPEASNFADAARGWGRRLKRAIDAELITTEQAQRAWQRSVPHD